MPYARAAAVRSLVMHKQLGTCGSGRFGLDTEHWIACANTCVHAQCARTVLLPSRRYPAATAIAAAAAAVSLCPGCARHEPPSQSHGATGTKQSLVARTDGLILPSPTPAAPFPAYCFHALHAFPYTSVLSRTTRLQALDAAWP